MPPTTVAPLTLTVGGIVALAAAMGVGRFVYTPILPFMVEAVPLTEAQAGVIASANYLGYLLGALGGALGRLPGTQRQWFAGGLIVSAATTAAMGLADTVGALMALRFLGGLASAFVLVFVSSLTLERLAAVGRSSLTPVLFSGVGLGIAASAIAVAALSNAGVGWRGQWLWVGIAALAAAVVSIAMVPPAKDAPSSPAKPDEARQDGRLLRLIAGYGLFGFGYVITATFLNTIVRAEPDLRFLEDLIWLIVGLAGAPSVALWAFLAGRVGAPAAIAFACLVEAAGVCLSVLSTAPAALVASAVLVGGTFMGITAIGLGHARALTSGNARRAIALMTAAFGLGQMIGPGFAGYAYRLGDSFLIPSLAAAAALVAAAALIARS